MKWGRKKSASPSSIINRVFPLSWFSKSKLKPESNNKPETTFEFPTPKSSGCRFYSMDEDDAFWRLSFRDEGRRSTGGINPLWNDHDHDHFELPVSDFDITKMEVNPTGQNQCRNFNEMVSDIKKMRGKQRINEVSNPGERVIFPVKEVKTKPKSTHVNKSCKSYSPRTECKIRAIEEMKRARRKSKRKEKVLEGSSVFDSCAVAKSSLDPEGDFRDSMVEMIRERGIGRAEDLEQLLACYLTLNRDEYHDLIIKVFQQIWFELLQNRVYFDC